MSGALSFLEQNNLLNDSDEKEKTQSSSIDSYIPSQEAIDKTAEEDFTTGSELIEKPIESGGIKKEDMLAMRFAPPFAGMSGYMFP